MGRGKTSKGDGRSKSGGKKSRGNENVHVSRSAKKSSDSRRKRDRESVHDSSSKKSSSSESRKSGELG